MRVPSSRSEDVASDREAVRGIFRAVAKEGRRMLTEPEAKAAIAAYGIPVPETIVAKSPAEVGTAAAGCSRVRRRIVVKLLSKAISHKSDVGGVVLNIETADAAAAAARSIEDRVRELAPDADIEGFAVQPMVVRKQAQELILGMSRDPIFGPVILFGAGGVAVEVMDDTAIALPPLDDVLAGDLIERTRIGRLLAGFRDRKPADRAAIVSALNGLSQMIVDFPCIVSMDINPLLADAERCDRARRPHRDRAGATSRRKVPIRRSRSGLIRPSGKGTFSVDDVCYRIRPIKPGDVELYPDFLAKVSPEDIRLRFLSPRKSFDDHMLKRLTQLDYDRDMAFVALEPETGKLAGVGRLSCDPDRAVAEYALLVRTDLQGHGLGWALLKQIVDYATVGGRRPDRGHHPQRERRRC